VISRGPSTNLLASCSSLLKRGDAILFIEDGIYFCFGEFVDRTTTQEIPIYALSEDLIARGLIDRSNNAAELVDYNDFVRLCCQYEKIVSWF